MLTVLSSHDQHPIEVLEMERSPSTSSQLVAAPTTLMASHSAPEKPVAADMSTTLTATSAATSPPASAPMAAGTSTRTLNKTSVNAGNRKLASKNPSQTSSSSAAPTAFTTVLLATSPAQLVSCLTAARRVVWLFAPPLNLIFNTFLHKITLPFQDSILLVSTKPPAILNLANGPTSSVSLLKRLPAASESATLRIQTTSSTSSSFSISPPPSATRTSKR